MPELGEFSVEPTAIDGLVIITLKAISDTRGTVREYFRRSALAEAGIDVPERWEQVNLTESVRGAIRGLHGEQMTKLIGVAAGTAFGAYVDARRESRTYGTVVQVPDLHPGVQVFVPPGVTNGFQTTSETSQYLYCFDAEWVPGMAGVAINPLDPALAIEWPIADGEGAILSDKDRTAPMFVELVQA